MKLKGRVLRQRREEEQPTPVFLYYPKTRTPDEALAAALRAGRIPPNAAIVLLPKPFPDREAWQRHCQAEWIERERQRIEAQQPTLADVPAGKL